MRIRFVTAIAISSLGVALTVAGCDAANTTGDGGGGNKKGAAGDGTETRHGSASLPAGGRGTLDGGADPRIGAAAAQVTGHRLVDGRIVRIGISGKKRRRAHQLAGLAITALGHLFIDPGLLQRV